MKNIMYPFLIVLICSSLGFSQEIEKLKEVTELKEINKIQKIGEIKEISEIKKSYPELKIEINDGETAELYIDGIKCDLSIMDLLDPQKIVSVEVIKNELAEKNYNTSEDVILITSINNKDYKAVINTEDYDVDIKVKGGKKGKEPVIIIDAIVVKKSRLNKLDPNEIETINVIKGDEAIKKYNAPNGVIVVTTKKN
jgi:hypothetical protein